MIENPGGYTRPPFEKFVVPDSYKTDHWEAVKQISSSLISRSRLGLVVRLQLSVLQLILNGDATIRTKYQIRTKVEFGPKTNSDPNFNYLVIKSN